MRIAIITDIHGNSPALRAVLRDIDKKGDIEHIYCLGDMIGIGPNSNEVLEMLFSREDISIVTGNHDEAVLALAHGLEYPQSHFRVIEHHQWILDRLDKTFIPALEQLPRTISREIDGHSILFTHYHIADDKMMEHISKDPFSPIVDPSVENMEKLFLNREESLICFGHHHPLHYFCGSKAIYLNPGSLGCTHKPMAPYGIVTFSSENGSLNITLEEVPYDNIAFLESFRKLKVPGADFVLKVFHGNQI